MPCPDLSLLKEILKTSDPEQLSEDDLIGLTPTELRALNWAKLHYTQLTDLNVQDNLRVMGIPVSLAAQNTVDVFTVDDFPDPVSNVITLVAGTVYFIKGTNVDIGNNQLAFAEASSVEGQGFDANTITTSTTLPAFLAEGLFGLVLTAVRFEQTGTGDLFRIDMDAFGFFEFLNCIFSGGDVRCINGLTLNLKGHGLRNSARIIQDASGGVRDLRFVELSGIRDGGEPLTEGIVIFETGSITGSFMMDDGGFVLLNAATIGIKINEGALIRNLSFTQMGYLILPGAIGIVCENPDDILLADLPKGGLSPGGTLLACEPISSSTSSLTGSGTMGVCQDGVGNLIISDDQANTIQRYTDLTNIVNGAAIAAPASDVGQLAWSAGVLYSIDSGTVPGRIYFHAGYTVAGVNDFIASPADDPSGVVFVGENMITTDSETKQIYVHDGFSINILDTIDVASVVGTPFGLAYDGVNLHIGDADDETVKIMRGVSNTLQYEFTSEAADQRDLWQVLDFGLTPKEVGYVVTDLSTNAYHLYDHPVTFDHSSRTWEIEGIPGVIESTDRGGSEFSTTTPVTVTLAGDNLWRDIEDSGVAIFYECFLEFEKMALNNEQNGEILWLSPRERGRTIAAQATFSRTGNTELSFFEIAVVINGIVQKDSITSGLLANASTTVLTLTTLPISRDIVLGTIIKIQIRRTAMSGEPEISFAKVSIT